MEIQGNVWRIYPNDAPGYIGRDSGFGSSPIFVHRIRWQPDGSSASGDAVHVKDASGYTIFFHEAVTGETFYEDEFGAPLTGQLELAALDSGVLQIYIE